MLESHWKVSHLGGHAINIKKTCSSTILGFFWDFSGIFLGFWDAVKVTFGERNAQLPDIRWEYGSLSVTSVCGLSYRGDAIW